MGLTGPTKEGEVIPNARLVTPADPPRSYAYMSDTRYVPNLWRKGEGRYGALS